MPEPSSLSLAELLTIANDAYPDGFLAEYFERDTGTQRQGSGDRLAAFIVAELTETFVPGTPRGSQLEEARIALHHAVEFLRAVIEGLD